MSVYTYFILGILVGILIAVVFCIDRIEKFENKIKLKREIFCTEKLDNMIEVASNRIARKIEEKKDVLSEAEKNEIIAQCCKEKFGL